MVSFLFGSLFETPTFSRFSDFNTSCIFQVIIARSVSAFCSLKRMFLGWNFREHFICWEPVQLEEIPSQSQEMAVMSHSMTACSLDVKSSLPILSFLSCKSICFEIFKGGGGVANKI